MHRLFLVLAIAACGETKAPPAPARVPRDDAGAASRPAFVELLHAVPSTVRVSSQVANRSITPQQLVDRDRGTAWNSRTGDLVGAWIDVAVEHGTIAELRLTVGHTGTGPRGEDYFTMNPRIRKLAVLHAGGVVASVTLDPDRRDLQSIVLPAPVKQVRLRVDEIVRGTKSSWREICVSELEAWGSLAGGAGATLAPTVAVGAPDTEPQPIVDLDSVCEQPACGVVRQHVVLEEPWLSVGILERRDDDGRVDRQIALQTAAGWWTPSKVITCGPSHDDEGFIPNRTPCTVELGDVRVKGALGIEVEYAINADEAGTSLHSVTCGFVGAAVTCRAPIDR